MSDEIAIKIAIETYDRWNNLIYDLLKKELTKVELMTGGCLPHTPEMATMNAATVLINRCIAAAVEHRLDIYRIHNLGTPKLHKTEEAPEEENP